MIVLPKLERNGFSSVELPFVFSSDHDGVLLPMPQPLFPTQSHGRSVANNCAATDGKHRATVVNLL